MAIVSDEDVISIIVSVPIVSTGSSKLTECQGDQHPVDFATYLRHAQPPVHVEGKCEYIFRL